ncbi:acyl carrier protein [Calidifontibacter indicus]|uniref:acyl carrier protein n=1 Tax=Calidifontibacter indicus TaxID=419650 RepID=UPI003D73463E
MNNRPTPIFEAIREMLVHTLDLQVDPRELSAETALFGALPELDSLGVVALVAAMEDRFDIVVEDDEFGEQLFETVGTLTAFVDDKLAAA